MRSDVGGGEVLLFCTQIFIVCDVIIFAHSGSKFVTFFRACFTYGAILMVSCTADVNAA